MTSLQTEDLQVHVYKLVGQEPPRLLSFFWVINKVRTLEVF